MTGGRGQRGFTLVELLLAASLMLIVLGAVLTTFEKYIAGNRRNQLMTQDTSNARNAVDLVSRDVRSATGYATAASTGPSVLRAGAQDFAFKTVDPFASATTGNDYRVRTVRYCYSSSRRQLLRQAKADAVVPAAVCPDPAFTSTEVAGDVTNGARTVFTYDAATPASITEARVDLYVDSTPGAAPAETLVSSGVFLRNANRAPTAAFNARTAANRHVELDASASVDPDGRVLTYSWQDQGVTLPQTGPVVDYVAPAAGMRTFTLTVTDAGGLTATADPQTIDVQP